MANPEQLEILKQGVEAWNKWTTEADTYPDLSSANLAGLSLNHVNFMDCNLDGANLNGASLIEASLFTASLIGANLANTRLDRADLYSAELINANLTGASLTGANLEWANLREADLSKTDLHSVNFARADLSRVNFSSAEMGYVIFGGNDISSVKGLETVRHTSPSFISVDTVYYSEGNIPEVFLRGCGIPDEFITYMRSLVAHPIQFYSCFISYSSKNQLFADRLYADLQNKGVRCWLASEDLKIGEKIRIGIDESIRFHDKLLLVLSKYSVASDWVEQEVETALDRERREKRIVLFPIRLDDTVMKIDVGWPALIKNTRNIGDFRRWRNPESYRKAFDRLLRDLTASK